MKSKYLVPDDPAYKDNKGDPMPYGRHKKAEQERTVEWVEKLRQKKIPIRETFSTMLKNPGSTTPRLKTNIEDVVYQLYTGKKDVIIKTFNTYDGAYKFVSDLVKDYSNEKLKYGDLKWSILIKPQRFGANLKDVTLLINLKNKTKRGGKRARRLQPDYLLTARFKESLEQRF